VLIFGKIGYSILISVILRACFLRLLSFGRLSKTVTKASFNESNRFFIPDCFWSWRTVIASSRYFWYILIGFFLKGSSEDTTETRVFLMVFEFSLRKNFSRFWSLSDFVMRKR
jgi:hypothetical protein